LAYPIFQDLVSLIDALQAQQGHCLSPRRIRIFRCLSRQLWQFGKHSLWLAVFKEQPETDIPSI
jgi:hypothetical protein